MTHPIALDTGDDADEASMGLSELAGLLLARWKLILGAALAAGVAGYGIALLLPPTFTARTTVLPPQQQQTATAAAIGQLGTLAGIAGGFANVKSPAEQYIALMQSALVADQIIAEFKLMDVYGSKYRIDARRQLAGSVRITVGRKDGLLTVEVDDRDAARGAAIANSHVDGLRRVLANLALTEAQQRRVFFEQNLQQTKDRLTQAQIALQGSGINQGALKVEPKAVAESYATLRAEAIAAEVKLQALQSILVGQAPELLQQRTIVKGLRGELGKAESMSEVRPSGGSSDYITKYREFKYQETLFDLFARQYELARLDESREGALIQVVDVATPAERRSKPQRAMIALGCAALATLVASAWVVLRAARAEPKDEA